MVFKDYLYIFFVEISIGREKQYVCGWNLRMNFEKGQLKWTVRRWRWGGFINVFSYVVSQLVSLTLSMLSMTDIGLLYYCLYSCFSPEPYWVLLRDQTQIVFLHQHCAEISEWDKINFLLFSQVILRRLAWPAGSGLICVQKRNVDFRSQRKKTTKIDHRHPSVWAKLSNIFTLWTGNLLWSRCVGLAS